MILILSDKNMISSRINDANTLSQVNVCCVLLFTVLKIGNIVSVVADHFI